MNSPMASSDISPPAPRGVQSPAQEVVSTLATRMLFWRARYIKRSQFLHHLPFLFWLIETHRPNSFVELGVGEGVSYFAACQAMDKLNMDVRCHGVDTEIADGVRKYNDDLYQDFSRLIEADLREAVHRFPDESIDLLLVDVEAEPGVLDSLSRHWVSKLSSRGVVLLHGLNTRFNEARARKFLDRILGAYPTVAFEGGDGLVAVLFGPERHERLATLARLKLGMPGYTDVHRLFMRLGAAHHLEWLSGATERKNAEMKQKLQAAEKTVSQADKAKTALDERLAEINEAYDLRHDQIAQLQAGMFDLQQKLEAERAERAEAEAALKEKRNKARTERDTAKENLAALTAEMSDLRAVLDSERAGRDADRRDVEALRSALDEKEVALSALRTEIHRTGEEAEVLRSTLAQTKETLEAKAADAHTFRTQLDERFREIAVLTQMLEDKNRSLEDMRASRDALLQSTTWKLTAPARKVLEGARRGKKS